MKRERADVRESNDPIESQSRNGPYAQSEIVKPRNRKPVRECTEQCQGCDGNKDRFPGECGKDREIDTTSKLPCRVQMAQYGIVDKRSRDCRQHHCWQGQTDTVTSESEGQFGNDNHSDQRCTLPRLQPGAQECQKGSSRSDAQATAVSLVSQKAQHHRSDGNRCKRIAPQAPNRPHFNVDRLQKKEVAPVWSIQPRHQCARR